MIDSLKMMRPRINRENATARFGFKKDRFGLVTLNRPSNVDDNYTLSTLCDGLIRVSQKLPLIFPVHPRTRKNFQNWGLAERIELGGSIHMSKPLSYIQFMNLLFDIRLAITDSDGI